MAAVKKKWLIFTALWARRKMRPRFSAERACQETRGGEAAAFG